MATVDDTEITVTLTQLTEKMLGLPCLRQEVGEYRSLSLGFGCASESDDSHKRHRRYCNYEVGTYSDDWMVRFKEQTILSTGERKSLDRQNRSVSELLNGLKLVSIRSVERLEVVVELEKSVKIIFRGSNEVSQEEIFHIFLPNSNYAEFRAGDWHFGSSKTPWEGGKLIKAS